jgi:hypothetical protein
MESTRELIERVRSGDPKAREHLFSRFLPPLRRWAHGRIPDHVRSLLDTDDLVQNSLFRVAWSGVPSRSPPYPICPRSVPSCSNGRWVRGR